MSNPLAHLVEREALTAADLRLIVDEIRAQVARELEPAEGVLAQLWAAIEVRDRAQVVGILRHERDLLTLLARFLDLITIGPDRA
jgi:hypothetical protein